MMLMFVLPHVVYVAAEVMVMPARGGPVTAGRVAAPFSRSRSMKSMVAPTSSLPLTCTLVSASA